MRKKLRGRLVRAARRLGLGAFAALAALAMLAPSLTPIVGDELAAYRPDHGHLVAGAVPPHEHPYDDPGDSHRPSEGATLTHFGAMALGAAESLRASAASEDAVPPIEAGDHEQIVFTHGGDGTAGSTSAPALPGGAAVAASAEGWALRAAPSEPPELSSLALLVAVPPPRA